jgi:hypothetical protein
MHLRCLTPGEVAAVTVLSDDLGLQCPWRIQFEIGTTDLLSVLKLQGRLLSGRAVQIAVEQERLSNWINLHLALGGSFQ